MQLNSYTTYIYIYIYMHADADVNSAFYVYAQKSVKITKVHKEVSWHYFCLARRKKWKLH